MADEKWTVADLLNNFDNYRRAGNSVLIHPGMTYGFIEVTPEFADRLRQALQQKLMLVRAGLDEMDPMTQFTVMILEGSH